eukprot:CAMPEP_0197884882 /NCGR_PEP_ID=MMETSP1439-20131203/11186_1 /TAXON_ID=66791 /ORGANISM="Gonyaulax spinifera, Strain CCMP409" /LENGTH=245 /DNA_ID=CAMNT_0043504627 /DNA_START=59 /DNA_END=794 /DNA_ORIENTATION=-
MTASRVVATGAQDLPQVIAAAAPHALRDPGPVVHGALVGASGGRRVRGEPTRLLAQALVGLGHQQLEGELHILRVLGACLYEGHAQLLCQLLALLLRHRPLVDKVRLVANQETAYALRGMLLDLLDPASHILEGAAVRDVVHQHDAVRAAVVAVPQASESLLSSSVPDGHLHYLAVHQTSADFEVNADRAREQVLEVVLRKTDDNARLADAGVPDKQELQEAVVLDSGHGPRGSRAAWPRGGSAA